MKYRIAAVSMLGVVAIVAMAYLAGSGNATADSPTDNAAYSGVTNAIGGQAGLLAANASGSAPIAGATPIAVADTYSVAPGASLSGNLLTNDTNAGSLLPADADPWTGTDTPPSLSIDGSFTYTANGTPGTSYSFSYFAMNGLEQSVNPATVTITIETAGAAGGVTVAAAGGTTVAAAGGSDGAALFKASCATCHTSGTVKTALSNADVVLKMTAPLSMAKYANTSGTAWTTPEKQAVADFIVPPATGGGTPATTGSGSPATTPAPAEPGTGAGVYSSYCAACHGADLTGTPKGPGVVGESRSEIAKVVRNGDGTMPAFSSTMISDESLGMLSDYMATFGSKSGHDDDDDDESDDDHGTTTTTAPAAIGSSVYSSYCAACHGADGTGTPLGPDIVGESRGETFDVVRNGDDGMPAFSATMLSDADLQAVADYVAALGGGSDDHGDDDKKSDDHDEKKSKDHDEDDD